MLMKSHEADRGVPGAISGLKFERRNVLLLGYAAVIIVLVLSVVEAYRIQVNVSQQHIDIFYRYVDEEQALTTLRRDLWLAGNYIRDFFISPTPAEAQILASHLKELEKADELMLNRLALAFPNDGGLSGLRKGRGEFWQLLDRVPREMAHTSDQEQMDFVRDVVDPKRGKLYDDLGQFTAIGERGVQNSSQEIIQTRHRAAQRLLATLVLGGLLCVLLAWVSIRHSDALANRVELHYAEVEEARSEMQQLSARLLDVEEQGRRHLARELHDEIGQKLALLQIELSRGLNLAGDHLPKAAEERLLRARVLAEDNVNTIRDISALLRPAVLDDLGLVPALHFQIEQFQRRSGISGEFTEENVADQLPDRIKTCVYRVVQEALHNCEKHSRATEVQVQVSQDPAFLKVVVQDNGAGFRPNDKGMPFETRGLGLLGMRERAAMAGGSVEIESMPGHGTRISLRIPVARTSVSAMQH